MLGVPEPKWLNKFRMSIDTMFEYEVLRQRNSSNGYALRDYGVTQQFIINKIQVEKHE